MPAEILEERTMCAAETVVAADAALPPLAHMYRVYNPNADLHVQTSNAGEYQALLAIGLRDEDRQSFSVVAAPGVPGTVPIHRLYDPFSGAHYLTANSTERDTLVSLGWNFEKDEGFVYTAPQDGVLLSPVHRLYNAGFGREHLFLTDDGEMNAILQAHPGVWVRQADLGYAFAEPVKVVPPPTEAFVPLMFTIDVSSPVSLDHVSASVQPTSDIVGTTMQLYVNPHGGGFTGSPVGSGVVQSNGAIDVPLNPTTYLASGTWDAELLYYGMELRDATPVSLTYNKGGAEVQDTAFSGPNAGPYHDWTTSI